MKKSQKKKRADHFSGLHAVKYILCLFLFTVSCTNFRCTTTHGDTHVCDTVFALHEVYTVAFLYPKHLSGLKRILIGGEEKEFPFVDILLVFNALFDICGAELFAGIFLTIGDDYAKYILRAFFFRHCGKFLAHGIDGNADGIIQLDSTSLGAYAAKVGETLPEDYVQKNTYCNNPDHNHISPDRVVDASAGLLPDTTFYFDNQRHDLTARNDVILKLALNLIESDRIQN